MKRIMGKSGIETSAMGMGCWAIGGEWDLWGNPAGWGKSDDKESVRAIEAAYDNGITLFDTAATYGVGHSEKLVGKALKGKRENCIISTKFGFNLDIDNKNVINYGDKMETADVISHLKADCEASLKRLDTDYIDLFLFHIWDYDKVLATEMLPVLEELVDEGKIKSYGWSTNDTSLAELWLPGKGYTAVMNELHVASDDPATLSFCKENNIAALNKAPLAMGFLTGKYNANSKFPAGDVRDGEWARDTFQKPISAKLDDLRDVLTSEGRTLAQGALAWIWAKSPFTIPTPGIRTIKQAIENGNAMQFGPLKESELNQIEEIMGRVN